METEGKKAGPIVRMQGVAISSMRDQQLAVVENVNWEVKGGDFWVVAGLQGAGKTDFLMTLAGLMPPLEGSYHLFNEQMPIFDEARLAERLRLGLVFDGGQLFNHLTVWENVALPLRYHKNLSKADALGQVQGLLDALDLASWAESTPGALARNWQKRVGLARALILKPELLLVDNPLGGLDFRHLHWWLRFLKELSNGHPLLEHRPITLVVSTADLRPWKALARQFALLENRRFSVLGDWAQVEAASQELLRDVLPAESRPG